MLTLSSVPVSIALPGLIELARLIEIVLGLLEFPVIGGKLVQFILELMELLFEPGLDQFELAPGGLAQFRKVLLDLLEFFMKLLDPLLLLLGQLPLVEFLDAHTQILDHVLDLMDRLIPDFLVIGA